MLILSHFGVRSQDPGLQLRVGGRFAGTGGTAEQQHVRVAVRHEHPECLGDRFSRVFFVDLKLLLYTRAHDFCLNVNCRGRLYQDE